MDPLVARQFLTQPSRLLELDSALVQKVRRRAPCHELCAERVGIGFP